MKQDRLLLIILAVIGGLVALALTLFFVRQRAQEYGPENTPSGVVRNYALALEKKDYQRAYSYLADLETTRRFEDFRRYFLGDSWRREEVALRIVSERIAGEEAWVDLTIIHSSGGGIFGEAVWQSDETAILVFQNNAWKITQMPSPYWDWEWTVRPKLP